MRRESSLCGKLERVGEAEDGRQEAVIADGGGEDIEVFGEGGVKGWESYYGTQMICKLEEIGRGDTCAR